jgi:hypothetical protein
MLLSNECPSGESLRGMPAANASEGPKDEGNFVARVIDDFRNRISLIKIPINLKVYSM